MASAGPGRLALADGEATTTWMEIDPYLFRRGAATSSSPTLGDAAYRLRLLYGLAPAVAVLLWMGWVHDRHPLCTQWSGTPRGLRHHPPHRLPGARVIYCTRASRTLKLPELGAVPTPAARPATTVLRALAVVALLFVFLVGVKGLGDGFKSLGEDVLDSFFAATSSPFVALMIGILATTLAQSSSVTTSMIVALVAAPVNPLPLANAVPMIMGANIGTTVTNSIVSIGHMGRPAEFRRAFAVATCHDFFNLGAVAILLPLELATGFLRRLATLLAGALHGSARIAYESPLKAWLKIALAPVRGAAEAVAPTNEKAQAMVVIGLSAVLIFAALGLIVHLLRSLMKTRVEVYLSRALGQTAPVLMLVGAILTVMVQSSSITTSLLVPWLEPGS